jgi:hypothetical protein
MLAGRFFKSLESEIKASEIKASEAKAAENQTAEPTEIPSTGT